MRIRAEKTIKKLLITSSLLAFALQGVAHAYPSDAEATQDLPATRAHFVHPETTTTEETALPSGPPLPYTSIAGDPLERAFWACDYAATERGLSATPVELCGAVYEDLKNIKFGGDFNQLLLWWQENKSVEHKKMAREDHVGQLEPLDGR